MRQTVAVGTGDFAACLNNQKDWERAGDNPQWKIHNRALRSQTAITTAIWRVGYENWPVNFVLPMRGKSYLTLPCDMNEGPTTWMRARPLRSSTIGIEAGFRSTSQAVPAE